MSGYLGCGERVGSVPDHLGQVGDHELKDQDKAQALRKHVQQSAQEWRIKSP